MNKSNRSWKKKAITLICLLLSGYIISYLPHRAQGSYDLTQSGKIRIAGLHAISELQQWSPKDCWWQPRFQTIKGESTTRANGWGYFYSPLIAIDRKLNFPDKTIYK